MRISEAATRRTAPSAPPAPSQDGRRRCGRRAGFTIIELLVSVVIMGILASLAIPNYTRLRERAFVARAIGDIQALQQDITEYQLTTGSLPGSLADIGRGGIEDPWGHPYRYLPIAGRGKGGFRMDRFLVPINDDYDLYSTGADGQSQAPLTAKVSQDDIIRANDGGFVGPAVDF